VRSPARVSAPDIGRAQRPMPRPQSACARGLPVMHPCAWRTGPSLRMPDPKQWCGSRFTPNRPERVFHGGQSLRDRGPDQRRLVSCLRMGAAPHFHGAICASTARIAVLSHGTSLRRMVAAMPSAGVSLRHALQGFRLHGRHSLPGAQWCRSHGARSARAPHLSLQVGQCSQDRRTRGLAFQSRSLPRRFTS
jgi:hypothetical protein